MNFRLILTVILFAAFPVAYAAEDFANTNDALVDQRQAAQKGALASPPIVIGSNGERTSIPFTSGIPMVHQQVYAGWRFDAQQSTRISAVGFTSTINASVGELPQSMTVNVTIRMGTVNALPIGFVPVSELVTVFNGPLTVTLTGEPGDLTFLLDKGGYSHNPKRGYYLVIYMEVHSASGYSGTFLSGGPAYYLDTSRIYGPADASSDPVAEQGGLQTILYVK